MPLIIKVLDSNTTKFDNFVINSTKGRKMEKTGVTIDRKVWQNKLEETHISPK
jgi:hypothetical protein